MGAYERLGEICRQIRTCDNCTLSKTRKNSVPGEGPVDAEIMLISEAPGFHENEQGRPLIGAVGSYLNELLKGSGLTRDMVFITNVVKCRPPGNRDPLPDELAACSAFLDHQIETINPKLVITLGRYATARFFPMGKISLIHGQPGWIKGRLVVPMYHPAAALQQPALRLVIEENFSSLREWLNQVKLRHAVMMDNKPATPTAKIASNGLTNEKPAESEEPLSQLRLF